MLSKDLSTRIMKPEISNEKSKAKNNKNIKQS